MILSLLLLACGPEPTEPDPEPVVCVADPPDEATWRPGPQEDGSFLAVGGRLATPPGLDAVVQGLPGDVAVHPDGTVAYASIIGAYTRRMVVLDVETGAVLQDIDQGEAFQGVLVDPSGERLYVSGGSHHGVEVYDLDEDGLATWSTRIPVGDRPSGMALSPDGATLWVGMFTADAVRVIDTATLTQVASWPLPDGVWSLLHLPARDELYATDLVGELLMVVDAQSGEVLDELALPTSPAGLAARPDGTRVWVAVSGADEVVALDTATRSIAATARVAELDWVDASGVQLPNSNVNALWYDPPTDRLFVSRGADNAVSVLDGTSMAVLGSFPTAAYPTDLELAPDGHTLVIAQGKGGGMGPSEGRSVKEGMRGSLSVLDLDDVDLLASTEEVIAAYGRPIDRFPFDCEGDFPIPTRPGQTSPIAHVVLVVKENKTFDCVFGDVTDLDVEVDPELTRWGVDITPNHHQLAHEFAISDNFYDEVPNSDVGHLLITGLHMTEYVERIWAERVRFNDFLGYPLSEPAIPDVGNLFTHLIDHDVDFQIYGEVVGMGAVAENGGRPIEHSDLDYPGGPVVNYAFPDLEKVEHVLERFEDDGLPTFVYLSLPNDHTQGTNPGLPTPESMVADNDEALGALVEGLSKRPEWPDTLILVIEDDPQGCEDHVDGHRAFVLAIGPWVRRGYVSHAHASLLSVHATIERILGLPPIGRPDASAAPLWDMFTQEQDTTPYEPVPRTWPEEVVEAGALGTDLSELMSFVSPDRNPALSPLLDAWRLMRMGRITREEAEARLAHPDPERWEDWEEEAEEEITAFDQEWPFVRDWLEAHGRPLPVFPRGERPR